MTLIIAAPSMRGIVVGADRRMKDYDGPISDDGKKMYDIGHGVLFFYTGLAMFENLTFPQYNFDGAQMTADFFAVHPYSKENVVKMRNLVTDRFRVALANRNRNRPLPIVGEVLFEMVFICYEDGIPRLHHLPFVVSAAEETSTKLTFGFTFKYEMYTNIQNRPFWFPTSDDYSNILLGRGEFANLRQDPLLRRVVYTKQPFETQSVFDVQQAIAKFIKVGSEFTDFISPACDFVLVYRTQIKPLNPVVKR